MDKYPRDPLAYVRQTNASKRVWGLDVETVWVPFFRQAKAHGVLDIEDDVLTSPIRQGKVHPKLLDAISLVKANLEATLVSYGQGYPNYHIAQLVR